MLKVTGRAQSFCDRVSRRRFIEIGGLSTFGLSLPHLLGSEAAAAGAAGRGTKHHCER